jgi:hypothetical protein
MWFDQMWFDQMWFDQMWFDQVWFDQRQPQQGLLFFLNVVHANSEPVLFEPDESSPDSVPAAPPG